MKAEQELKIDEIFKSRFHGAVNVRGVRFQILYSVFRAFDLYNENINAFTLEGIEDLDLLGLDIGNEYIQVKTSQNIWHWNNLKKIIANFYEVYRVNPNCSFTLLINAKLESDVTKLMNFNQLNPSEKTRLKNKFSNLCKKESISNEDADNILKNLSIRVVSEDDIWNDLRYKISDTFDLGSDLVDIYALVLIAEFLDWAKDRKTVYRSDMENIRISIGQNLSREQEFQAYGRGLIDKISWEPDNKIADFFEGKGTRSGHIVANIDYRREFWLDKIKKAIDYSKICIIRSSSGQGKSSLLYRYAYENWPAENTFVINKVETSSDVELLSAYLNFRAKLGLPILLLIDDVGWQKRMWTSLLKECAALGINVLITTRHEDWNRFHRESLTTYEIIEPYMNLDEAKNIYELFESQNKVHKSVASAEEAYEKIGKPELLIEYIYLITHGRMLEDRLKDQINQILREEDHAKIKILRTCTLANVLGTSVQISELMNQIQTDNDKQFLLESLSEEYLKIDENYLRELHWVRSEHINKILHENYPSLAETALNAFDVIPYESISDFVKNAICMEKLDEKIFMNGLIQKLEDQRFKCVLDILSGIFEAGEQLFFEKNLFVFDEAYDLLGSSGPSLITSAFSLLGKIDLLIEIEEIFGGNRDKKLSDIALKAKKVPRGLDFCKEFLYEIASNLSLNDFKEDFNSIGYLIEWYSTCELQISNWDDFKENLLKSNRVFECSINDFCIFASGLYKYDQDAYCNWFFENRDDIIGYLKLNLNCTELMVDNNNILYIEYIPIDEEDNNGGLRLEKLKSAIPFCKTYKSKGIWIIPAGLTPNADYTIKGISSEKLFFQQDIERNMVLPKIIDDYYLPDSFYTFEDHWFKIRNKALKFVDILYNEVNNELFKKKSDFSKIDLNLIKYLDRMGKYTPNPPPQISKDFKVMFLETSQEWKLSFNNFFNQIMAFLIKRDLEEARLALINFSEAIKNLNGMHEVFDKIYENYPDYFDSKRLNATEIKKYRECYNLLDLWIFNTPPWLSNQSKRVPRTIDRYLKTIKAQKRNYIFEEIEKKLVNPLKDENIDIFLPNDIYLDPPLRYLPFAFSVEDFDVAYLTIFNIIDKLKDLDNIVDIFCIVPLYKKKAFVNGGYYITSHQIFEIVNGEPEKAWEALVPHEFPNGIRGYLKDFNFQKSPLFKITEFLGIISDVQSLAKWNESIDFLNESDNSFEVELYHNQLNNINEYFEKVISNISGFKEYLEENFPNQKEDQNYELILSILEAIENSNLDELMDISTVFNIEGNMDKMRNSLQNLLSNSDKISISK